MSDLAINPLAATNTMPSEALRRQFLAGGIFRPGEATLHTWDQYGVRVGAMVPVADPLALPKPDDPASSDLLERCEVGLINLGGPGQVTFAGVVQPMAPNDSLYLGRGTASVRLLSDTPSNPARFFLLGGPTKASHPPKHVPFSGVNGEALGTPGASNRRSVYRLIDPTTFPTGGLTLGLTLVEPGNIWSSFPPPAPRSRAEVLLYCNLPPGHAVFHFLGEPDATRHLVVHDSEAVLVPPGSIHCSAGTRAYGVVWGSAGGDDDGGGRSTLPIATLR